MLYTLFYIGALLAYMDYLKSGHKWKFNGFCLALFILSLLSKSAAVTLPLALIAIYLYNGRKISVRTYLEKIPLLALSVLFGILAIISQKGAMKIMPHNFSFMERIFLFSYSIVFYFLKLFTPFSLSVMHYYPNADVPYLPWYYYASVPLLLFLVWLIVKPSRLRRDKLLGTAFFLIAISVRLQIIPK